MTTRAEVGVLGPLVVRADRPIDVTRDAHRRLISILALAHGRRIATDQLIDRFWSEGPPATAKSAIQTHVSALRRLLPHGAITTEGRGYALSTDVCVLDVIAFERTAHDAHRLGAAHSWEDALESANGALDRWRGSPFEELIDDEFAEPERARLVELHAGVREVRADALLGLGRPETALPDLEEMVRQHPLRERSIVALATAQARLGRDAEALRAVHRHRLALRDAGLSPGAEIERVEHDVLARANETVSRHHRLPTPLTSFVGRSDEQIRLRELIASHRLVTLTGVGGTGKSRLALAVAHEVVADRVGDVDDAHLVELASLADPDRVMEAIATEVSVTADDDVWGAVERALGDRPVLLVVDNCEHLIEGVVGAVGAVLERCPRVRVMATSRLTLGLPGELVYEVPPMVTPPTEAPPSREEDNDAVRLFIDRARLVHPDVGASVDDLALAAEICRSLDGLPLAIELAAARTRTLGLGVLAERASERLRLLTGGGKGRPERHRTMRATIEWSHDLLDRDQQRLLARLGVFASPADLAAIEAVCGQGLDVAGPLTGLVEHSMVVTDHAEGRPVYRLLETVREFALERLEQLGEEPMVRNAHLRHLVTECEAEFDLADHSTVLVRGRLPVDDVRAALAWAHRTGDRRAVAVLAGWLGEHAAAAARISDAVDLIAEALTGTFEATLEARLRSRLALAYYGLDDFRRAGHEIERAVELARSAAPSPTVVAVLVRASLMAQLLVDVDSRSAVPLAREASAVAEEVGEPLVKLRALSGLASSSSWNGLDDEAIAVLEQALDLARAIGDRTQLVQTLETGINVFFNTDVDRRGGPSRMLDEVVRLAAEQGADVWPRLGDWLAWAALARGDDALTEWLIERARSSPLEGIDMVGHQTLAAALEWSRGRPDDAAREVHTGLSGGGNRRIHHDIYPFAAEIEAERGNLDDVRRLADEYLACGVHDTEEFLKVGVLRPLVRAEVDAALTAEDATIRCDHARRASDALDRMRRILRDHPPPMTGSIQVETPSTWIALAEAELTLLDADDDAVSAWEAVADVPDFEAYRRYAAQRLTLARSRACDRSAAAG